MLFRSQMIDDMLKFKRLDGVPQALTAIADGFSAGDAQKTVLRDSLAALGCPVQVLWGAADKIVPPAHAQGLPGNVKVEVLPGVGHLPHLEAANAVNAALLAILAAGWFGLELRFWHLFLSAFLQGCVNSIMQPSRQSMISDLVPRDRKSTRLNSSH